MADEKDKVGYGHPPLATRFKPGRSGNPKGRPKGIPSLKAELEEELGEKIRVREGDREYRTTKQRAVLKALVAMAVKGDGRAIHTLLNLQLKIMGDASGLDSIENVTAADRVLIAKFFDREFAKREGRGEGRVATTETTGKSEKDP